MSVVNICLYCNKEWHTNRKAIFCSSNCNHRHKYKPSNKIINICKNCSKQWTTYKTASFCSSNCNHIYKKRQIRKSIDLSTTCQACSTVFIAQKVNVKYCSKRCNESVLSKNRYNKDIEYKLRRLLRGRLYSAIQKNVKTGSSIKDLGCSIKELRGHLESQFTEDMTWSNHGKWHIDHIKPLSSFDLSNRRELHKGCNYKNLQPLWAEDNLRKGGK